MHPELRDFIHQTDFNRSSVKRLKSRPEVMRQRLGEYRLLFQLLPDRAQVIDLVPRQDFERRIKALAAARA